MGEADLQRNTLQAKVRLHEPDLRLRPGMLVRAAFHPGSSSASGATNSNTTGQNLAIFVPVDSLIDQSRESARVWAIENDRSRLRTLTLGTDQREGHIQVIKGLRPGDQVILPPFDALKENKRIRTISRP